MFNIISNIISPTAWAVIKLSIRVKAIMEVNSKRFRQTEGTPLRQEPYRSLLGLGETEYAKKILDGTMGHIPGLDPNLEKFLQFLKRPPNIPIIPVTISSQDYLNYWRKAKEKTSSLLSELILEMGLFVYY